ncbi:MAG: hypothetical protein IKX22_06890 [Prevotella sp.]|nr:hypothetical protein [Prevotella sp.]
MDIIKLYFYKFLQLIDDGNFLIKPTKWFYRLKGIPPFILPILIVSIIPGLKFFRRIDGTLAYIVLILYTIYLLAVSIFVFALWWNRSNNLEKKIKPGDDSVAIPLFADNIKSSGEIGAILFCLLVIGTSFFLYLLLATTNKEIIDDVHMYRHGTWLILFLSLIPLWLSTVLISYGIIFITRYISERMRLMATINNNIRDIADIHRAAIMVENFNALNHITEEKEEQLNQVQT